MLSRAVLVPLLLLSACGDAGGGSDTSSSSEAATSTTTATTAEPGTTTEPDPTAATTDVPTTPTDPTTGGAAEDLDMQPDDFVCILGWDKVRKFRVTNLLGHLDATLAVANDPAGGVYPVGTVIQLIPNEAMVKRRVGFAPDNNDWEYFALNTTADGTTISARGGTQEVVNGLGGSCFDCHAKAAPQWDRICEEGHGCDPLPFTAEQIEMVQQGDPRCP
jgi:hypothetical protein